jgi:uncharacterized protein YecT (DUF1311 family)
MRRFALPLLLLFCALARAASFDCAKANSPQEKAVCSSPELSSADDHLAAAFKIALASAPAGLQPDLDADQREWFRLLAVECPPNKIHLGPNMTACLLRNYQSRTIEIRQMVQKKAGITFVWRTKILINRLGPVDSNAAQQAGEPQVLIPGYGTLALSWPQAGLPSPEWLAWNQAIVEAAQKLASRNHPATDHQWHTEWAEDDDGDLQVAVGIVSPLLVTASIERWEYRGARPRETSAQFNWLLKERRPLRPEDLFRANSAWEKVVFNHCLKVVSKNHGAHSGRTTVAPGELHKIVADSENWQIEARGLTIRLPVNQLTERPAQATIPWKELKPYLNPAFVLPAKS